ncbi:MULTISPECIES: TetR/AcrR family transcriptional regulator [Bacillus]|uniref:TetR/AcrR family transcriptional regulator n=1 Tax=Bacillus TaxID=1386 RepID=UPI000A369DB7|nr:MULTISPECIES: TetR/AcrR family transcriptional regulator [Bacillus cereus group]MCU4804586.1 TetR/AcrR family transcriptional regulator [Bacillus cereus]MCU4819361.1 TetR/AcrR family transcriptional regulator [Bacillus cereus]MCU5101233.1 TetR/AcrR family transcriptional regulator [Bacillus cereus]MCU5143193.1 TetR/AcrR family transcriptional regulator [Bacillus cereus]MEC2709519.1 TetR/AcrR family transcriptional regulator [Bacillus thuringiensis]
MIKLEKENKKMKIIQSATILFSTRGVRNTTVDEIAKTAKVGKGTIYYYYTDKTEILCDCYIRHIQLKRSQLFNLYKEEKDVLLRIQKILHYISLEYHQDPFVSTLFQEYKEYHSPEITTCFKQSEEEAINMISNLLEKGYQQGALHKVPLPLTAFMLVRMIFNYEQDYIKDDKSDTEFLQLLKHMLLKN